MRDAVEILAQAYIDIRREGCIQFDDMLVCLHCNPKHATAIEVRLQSINRAMIGRTNEKTVLKHCEYLYNYLNGCIKKWRDNMDEKRRYKFCIFILHFRHIDQFVRVDATLLAATKLLDNESNWL